MRLRRDSQRVGRLDRKCAAHDALPRIREDQRAFLRRALAFGEHGIHAEGVDPDTGMVAEAQGHGRAVHLGDGLQYLRDLPANELGAVISVHVVEHLPLEVLVELLELSAARLKPGGVFVAETPNPMSLIVLGTFLRGPNWNFFGPYETWDPNKLEPLKVELSSFLSCAAQGKPFPITPAEAVENLEICEEIRRGLA